MKEKIAGCIVLYHPDNHRLEQVITSVVDQVDELFIHNNGLEDGKNTGIAFALNKL